MKTYKKKDYSNGTIKAFEFHPYDKELGKNLKQIKSPCRVDNEKELVIDILSATRLRLIAPPNVMVCIRDKQDGTQDYFTYSKHKFNELYAEVR